MIDCDTNYLHQREGEEGAAEETSMVVNRRHVSLYTSGLEDPISSKVSKSQNFTVPSAEPENFGCISISQENNNA